LEFRSEPDDHCETALEAYEHIKPLLLHLCKDLSKDACDLRIYDPYFCTGKTKKLLKSLGFSQVYNECDAAAVFCTVQRVRICLPPTSTAFLLLYGKDEDVAVSLKQLCFRNEDFYEKLRKGSLPTYDCLVTNPPFSGTHIEQLLQHCCSSGKPWLILMPTYVALKDWYQDLVHAASKRKASALNSSSAFYLVPRKRCVSDPVPQTFCNDSRFFCM
jgi:hypothetical protein